MRKFIFAAAAVLSVASMPAAVLAQEPAAAGVSVSLGKMIFANGGQRLAPVYRVTSAGDPQIILNGKLVTIPASTLSDVGGKLTTSLERKDVGRAS